MYRLRQLFDLSSGASVALAAAMAIVIVSCSTSPTNPVSPSATTPDAASAGGIRPATNTTPDPTPTPGPTPSPSPGTGRFTGGGNTTIEEFGKITYGFTIHCDLLLSNNLEINWGSNNGPGQNNFHMLEHVETVSCTDDPAIDQKPPVAPVDTIVGLGTGTFNNEEGFSVEFTLVDGGEPSSNDKIAFRIFVTATNVTVLEFSEASVGGGNVQAHFDQPHKDK